MIRLTMTKNCHLFLCVTLIITAMNVVITESAMTTQQMITAGAMMRESCQPQFDLNDEIIDGLKVGKFPENDKLMCYVNCIMELMTLIRNGVPNFEFAIKGIKSMLPEELRESYLNGVNACTNAAEGIVGDKCRVAYTLLQCFYQNNPIFMFP